ncbi:MAG: glucosaminidase domain-containing protein [Methylococcales bacterium]|nr:glucosaminidase domain-containing protein [Methylococcales bacterium]
MKHTNKLSGLISLVFVVISILAFNVNAKTEIPDFAAMKDVKQKKHAFFEYMFPLIEKANKDILIIRAKIKALPTKEVLTADDNNFLQEVAKKYSVKTEKNSTKQVINALLQRIDYIPPALALAQSANESAWGTSRFATKANNFFGQWCFKKGCGIVPSRRDKGSKHEVRKFSSTQGSVHSYVHNINTGRAYASLRKVRSGLRNKNKMLTGHDLAHGLTKYSSRGTEYVKEIRSMIRTNKLKNYDNKFWESSVSK